MATLENAGKKEANGEYCGSILRIVKNHDSESRATMLLT